MPRYLIEGEVSSPPGSLSPYRAGDIKFDAANDKEAKELRMKLFAEKRFLEHRFYRLEPI